MSSEESVKRNVVRRSSLEYANRDIYPNLSQEPTANQGLNTPPGAGKLYPFFVPSTVKSTLGSPVSSPLLSGARNPLIHPDRTGNRSIFYYLDNPFLCFDGNSRAYSHECLHRKLLLWYVKSANWISLPDHNVSRWYWNGHLGSMGACLG